MLVLTRKQNEKIRIGDSIVITIVKLKGKGVRLGIEAPSDVSILRGELAFEDAEKETQPKTAKTSLVGTDSSQAMPTEAKSTSPSKPTLHRNPTSQWTEQSADVVTSPMLPTLLADVAR